MDPGAATQDYTVASSVARLAKPFGPFVSSPHSSKEKHAKWSSSLLCRLLNRLGKPALPKLVIIYGHEQIQFSDAEIQEIYAGMCWYECERKKLGTDELRTLFGLLAGVEGMETFTKLPPFVIKFIQGDNDPFTDEVRRAATFNKESLLRKVDAVWQNHLHPTLPRGDEAAGTMWSQASISTPDP